MGKDCVPCNLNRILQQFENKEKARREQAKRRIIASETQPIEQPASIEEPKIEEQPAPKKKGKAKAEKVEEPEVKAEEAVEEEKIEE